MNLSRVVLNSLLGSAPFEIARDPGSSVTGGGYFGRGGFIPVTQAASIADTLTAKGIITPARPQELLLVEEGDRQSGVVSILTTTQLLESAEGPPAHEADIVTWNGLQYRVVKVLNWSAYGYWQALATQISTA